MLLKSKRAHRKKKKTTVVVRPQLKIIKKEKVATVGVKKEKGATVAVLRPPLKNKRKNFKRIPATKKHKNEMPETV